MKIAFLGSRGIPARYSGFETFYEQLAVRLAARGHAVTVYNRSHFIKDVRGSYKGVRLISLPSIPTKHLDTITHTALSTLDALFRGYDIVYTCIVGNSPLVWLPRLAGAKTLLNVDGEDWAREKWSGFARWYQRKCEWIATKTSNVVISDARGIAERYQSLYKKDTIFVPYGANIQRDERTEALERWGLNPRGYYLYVGRFVPENAIDLLIRAFRQVKTQRRLVIVGDAPYMDEYKKSLTEMASEDPRIVFTGYAFGADYAQLSSHAYAYVQPSGIDGTRPALLDQMGFGNAVLVRNSKVNMEVIEEGGARFDRTDPESSLVRALQDLDDSPERVQNLRLGVRRRIEQFYNWDWITEFYEELFLRLVEKRPLISYDNYLANQRPTLSSPLAEEPAIPRVNVLGIGVHATDPETAQRRICCTLKRGGIGYVCVTGAHGIIESQRDAELRRIHNNSLLTLPDGMPTVWFGQECGFTAMRRVYGPNLMLRMLGFGIKSFKESVDSGPSHFFYGSTPDVLERLTVNVRRLSPGVRLAGAFSPPFRSLTEDEWKDAVDRIWSSGAECVWVGLSTPKQERFIAELSQRLMQYKNELLARASGSPEEAPIRSRGIVVIGVGAAFDLHAGVRKDAPQWVQNAGLHWLYRLIQEPRRLGPRYARVVPSFLWLGALQLLGIRHFRLDKKDSSSAT